MIQVHVSKMGWDTIAKSHVVVLQALDSKRELPIWIGPAEFEAIGRGLQGLSYERPLTHDLLRIAIEGLGAQVKRIVITELRGPTYYARIILNRDDEIISVDARPSDSIALALRARAPIYIDRQLFDSQSHEEIEMAGGEPDPDADAEADAESEAESGTSDPVQRLLDQLKPPEKPEA
jgi:uncharacterized protein